MIQISESLIPTLLVLLIYLYLNGFVFHREVCVCVYVRGEGQTMSIKYRYRRFTFVPNISKIHEEAVCLFERETGKKGVIANIQILKI